MRRLIALCSICLLYAAAVFGEEADVVVRKPAKRLDEVVVLPTREPDTLLAAPYMADTLDGQTIRSERQSRTMPEALKEVTAVSVQKTGHGQGSPYLRGYTGFRTLLMVDGVRLNNSVFREGANQYWNTVDPLSLDRIELVKGPSSVLYGSDAIGGSVDALTIEPDFDDPSANRRFYYRGASAERSHVGRVEYGDALNDQLGVILGISVKDFGELEGGDEVGRQSHTGYDEIDWDAKAVYRVDDHHRLTLAHQDVDQNDAWRSHSTIYGFSWEGTTIGSDLERSFDQDRQLTYLKWDGSELPSFAQDIHVTLSMHQQDEDQFRHRSDESSDRQSFDVDTFGASLQIGSETPMGDLVYGVEYYRDDVSSSSKRYNADGTLRSVAVQGPVADDSTYDLAGIYLQDSLALADRVDLILGGRYNYAEADVGKFADPALDEPGSFNESWDAVVGSARLVAWLDDEKNASIFGGVSQGFRTPNLSDLTRLDVARTDEQEVPTPNVDPEYYTSFEAGAKASRESWYAQAAYFYTDMSDVIVRTPTGRTTEDGLREVTKKNSGDGYTHGVELEGSLDLAEDWVLRGGASWMEGYLDTFNADGELREDHFRTQPTLGFLALRWNHPAGRFWIEGLVIGADEEDRLSGDDKLDTQRIPPGGTPGYTVATLRSGWQATEDLHIGAAVENITDEDYRVHGSGVNEPGRNFVMTADLVF